MAPSVLKGGALRWPLQSICRAQAAAQQSDFRIRADAALVLGASVFPHRPCQELQARLDHALQLWRHQCVPVVMVSGGGSGLQDEMMVMTRYLLSCGLPGRCILPCAPGDNTFQSLCSLADLQATLANARRLTDQWEAVGGDVRKLTGDPKFIDGIRSVSVGLGKFFGELYPAQVEGAKQRASSPRPERPEDRMAPRSKAPAFSPGE